MFTCLTCKNEFDDAMRAMPNNQCRPCKNAYRREWQKANKDYANKVSRDYYAANIDEQKARMAEYRAAPEMREKAKQVSRAWYRDNKDHALEWARQNLDRQRPMKRARHTARMSEDADYAAKHRLNVRVCRARRRAAEAANIAVFYAAKIKAIYAACPAGMEVDHIHPLLGETFCGLHVPWNLQYLPRPENRAKRNKMPEETA